MGYSTLVSTRSSGVFPAIVVIMVLLLQPVPGQALDSEAFPAEILLGEPWGTSAREGIHESIRETASESPDNSQTLRRLAYTGQADRTFLLFHIYAIAHYAEAMGAEVIGAEAIGAEATATQATAWPALTLDTVLTDERSKAILIRFQRKLSVQRIRDEFSASLRRNAKPEWLREAKPTVDAFMAAIDRDVKRGDQLAFHWLDGEDLLVQFNGEHAFAVTDSAFAKLIWSIWFGDKPACDRKALLAKANAEAAP